MYMYIFNQKGFNMNIVVLLLLLPGLHNKLVSGERPLANGLEIPPGHHPPRRRGNPGRNWESWTSPEGTLWYPGRIDYRKRQQQEGYGAGAAPSRSDTQDTSTRRYFSFEEGPQFLSEHRIANSAHSRYGQGGVEGDTGRIDSEQRGSPFEGQYGAGKEIPLPGETPGQFPVNSRDQYGAYANGKYAGNVPYGQYFLNGQRVPEAGGPLLSKPSINYVPGPQRGHYMTGQRGQSGQYMPAGNGQFVSEPDPHYLPENGQYLHPDYGALPSPDGEQNGHYIPENDSESYYLERGDDYYPDSEYPYYYDEDEDYDIAGVDGQGPGVYAPTDQQPSAPNVFYQHGRQQGPEIDGRISAGQSSHQDLGQPIHRPNPDTNHMIYAGRDFLPVPTLPPEERIIPDRRRAEAGRDIPNLVHRGTGIDGRTLVANQSFTERDAVRSGQKADSQGESRFEGRIPERATTISHRRVTQTTTTTPMPQRRGHQQESMPHHQTTSKGSISSTTSETTLEILPSTTIKSLLPNTRQTTHTIQPPTPIAAYNPERFRPVSYSTRSPPIERDTITRTVLRSPYDEDRARGRLSEERTHERLGEERTHERLGEERTHERLGEERTHERLGEERTHERLGEERTHERLDEERTHERLGEERTHERLDEERTHERPDYRPIMPTVQIDLSKLMPEEEIHSLGDTDSIHDTFHQSQTRSPQRIDQHPTLAPRGHERVQPHRQISGNRGTHNSRGTDTPNPGDRQPYLRRDQQHGIHSRSQPGSTGSGVRAHIRQSSGYDSRIRYGHEPRSNIEEGGSSEQRGGQQHGYPTYPNWGERPRYESGPRTDQVDVHRHRAIPERRRYESYQPDDRSESYNYAAGRDRTHAQRKPEIDSRPHFPETEARHQVFNPSDELPESESPPGVSHKGSCPSVSQCRCCRWNTQQTRKSMECLQPKFKSVEVQVCTEEYNGVCIKTMKRKTLKPDGTEVRMCSKIQLKRSCFVCCPTFYPRGHNQTCNGVLDGIDKRGLRVSVEADIGGFYQPPRVSKSAQSETPQVLPIQQDEAVIPAGYRDYHSSKRTERSDGVISDPTRGTQTLCVFQKTGAYGQRIIEKRPCPRRDEGPSMNTRGDNTTAVCCYTREQLQSLFLRYCCNTKRYNSRVYSLRQCCGSTKTSETEKETRPDIMSPTQPIQEPRRSDTGHIQRVKESDSLLTNLDSRPVLRSQTQTFPESHVTENKSPRVAISWVQSRSQSSPSSRRSEAKPIDSDTDRTRQGICCPPGTRLRSIQKKESREGLESQDASSEKSTGRKSTSNWMRLYSCCMNGNYLRKVVCCLKKTTVSPLCCKK